MVCSRSRAKPPHAGWAERGSATASPPRWSRARARGAGRWTRRMIGTDGLARWIANETLNTERQPKTTLRPHIVSSAVRLYPVSWKSARRVRFLTLMEALTPAGVYALFAVLAAVREGNAVLVLSSVQTLVGLGAPEVSTKFLDGF